jgi:hypothetical protein
MYQCIQADTEQERSAFRAAQAYAPKNSPLQATNCVSLDHATWHNLPNEDKAIWDTLSRTGKSAIINGTCQSGQLEVTETRKTVKLKYTPNAQSTNIASPTPTPITNTRKVNVTDIKSVPTAGESSNALESNSHIQFASAQENTLILTTQVRTFWSTSLRVAYCHLIFALSCHNLLIRTSPMLDSRLHLMQPRTSPLDSKICRRRHLFLNGMIMGFFCVLWASSCSWLRLSSPSKMVIIQLCRVILTASQPTRQNPIMELWSTVEPMVALQVATFTSFQLQEVPSISLVSTTTS